MRKRKGNLANIKKAITSTWFSLLFLASTASAASSPNYGDIQQFLNETARKHPNNAHVFTLGVSDTGEQIQGLAVGNGSVRNLVVATHHGNEYGSTEVARAFAASVAESPIAGQTLYVIPVLNVSGYNSRNRWEKSSDPNRDYPGPCGTEGPFHLKSTAALAKFVDEQQIVASATLHTYFPAVVYPWGFGTHDLSTPYDDLFKYLGRMATVESGYQVGNSTEVIYPAAGTYEDYAFWKHGIWSMLFELGSSHNPSDSDVAEMNRVNVPGLRRMMEKAPEKRADDHAFKGKCDERLLSLDRHDE